MARPKRIGGGFGWWDRLIGSLMVVGDEEYSKPKNMSPTVHQSTINYLFFLAVSHQFGARLSLGG